MVERGEAHVPIYFISQTLKGPEERYLPIKKLVLALIYTARKLRRYFQAHVVRVLTDQPLQQVLSKPEVLGRLTKWAVELGDYALEYRPRTAIKGQVVADFLAEVEEGGGDEKGEHEVRGNEKRGGKGNEPWWKLYTDGASNEEGSGVGLILVCPEGIELTYAIRLSFPSTNNEAEYESLLAGLRIARGLRVRKVQAHVDSLLVANQVGGTYNANDQKMKEYLRADALSKLAAVAFNHLAKEVKVETFQQPSVTESIIANVKTQGENWMTSLIRYLQEGTVPEDKEEERKLRVRAVQYEIIERSLYRKSYLGPSLKCISEEEAEHVVREIHEGICGMHMRAKMVVARAMRAGYYWPAMFLSTVKEIQKCDSCKIHAPVGRKTKSMMVPVSSFWPFQKWGIDIVGPFPEGTGRAKFLVVAIDYFTKWVEAKPLRIITGEQVKRFVWEIIICRFGLPYAIISDNGIQFANNPFREWCLQLKIKQMFTSVAHPRANSQVERANQSVVEGIKASLTYGTEAMILVEIGVPTHRTLQKEKVDGEDLRLNLNLADERREEAARREVEYKKKIERYYNARVKEVKFKTGK
ncbi:uncharacterized protein LOC143587251 [Bidens hawaiensis]|uniref:uncharacterized protein LOC143587251 n=1 Tax=Bidens hawaiensis TaxID=980011 RepID=UPI00404AD819